MNSDNTVYAALDSTKVVNDFMVSGFDFSAVPLNADIVGIEVKFERYSDVGAKAIDSLVTLTGIGTAAANKARGEQWQTTPTITTYGGQNDLWECPSVDAAIVRDSEFGVHIHATRAAAGTPATGGIDYVTVKVFYIEKDPQIFIWDGVADVEMTLHHTQITAGDPALSTAEGFMNITAAVNSAKTRLVNHGDQIRTAAAGAGSLLGTVAARDKPIWLAGQSEIDINRARYMFERANFYGQDEFEAVYGACGASPAFSYDGTRCIRIRTQLPYQRDLPRHVAKHGEMLTLGLFSGAIVFSKPGDPHEMRATHGASGVEVGDRLTGLSPMAGDALGVICQTRTELIRGLTPDVIMKSPVNAKRGGIEYTAVDMGRIVLCDGLGIFLADTPESFGAAERSYISQPVHPWLSPRLQAQISSEAASLRPVCALNVRNKNQMRLYFWDGWCLTMTLN